MNHGPCPYEDCDHELCLSVPPKTPAFVKMSCPGCKRELWYKLSRVEPEAFTLAEFAERYEVDESTKIVSRRHLEV